MTPEELQGKLHEEIDELTTLATEARKAGWSLEASLLEIAIKSVRNACVEATYRHEALEKKT